MTARKAPSYKSEGETTVKRLSAGFFCFVFLLPSLLVRTAGIAQKQCEWRKLRG